MDCPTPVSSACDKSDRLLLHLAERKDFLELVAHQFMVIAIPIGLSGGSIFDSANVSPVDLAATSHKFKGCGKLKHFQLAVPLILCDECNALYSSIRRSSACQPHLTSSATQAIASNMRCAVSRTLQPPAPVRGRMSGRASGFRSRDEAASRNCSRGLTLSESCLKLLDITFFPTRFFLCNKAKEA